MDRYESYADRQIREALERGDFDGLPGMGRPIPGIGRSDRPGWWARRWAERERARDALHRVAADVERALGSVWLLEDEEEVGRRVAALNERIDEANAAAGLDDPIPPVDIRWAVATWRRMGAMRRRPAR